MRKMIANHSANMRAETVSDAVYLEGRRSVVRKMRVKLSGALSHQSGIAQRRKVTREISERAPIYHEHVIIASQQISYTNITYVLLF